MQNWSSRISPNVSVPEEIVNCPELAASTGYAQAKQVAERFLANAGKMLGIPILILRLGFIGGQSAGTVKW